MQTLELLEKIRPVWINRVVQKMARGAGVRDDFRIQLDRFYDLLEQVVETGETNWLESILSVWSTSLTQTDLEAGQAYLTHLLSEMLVITHTVCRENLSEAEALEVMTELSPAFAYGFEKTAQYELQVKMNYISWQLSRSQEVLERLERSKSDFIAVAAHELKTPLTLVEGYAAMLGDMLTKTEDPTQANILLDGISTGTRRLRYIIDDMIDVSLIDNNLLSLNFQPVWINRLLIILRDEFAKVISERKQALEIENYPGIDEMTFGDPERLLQVFRNVLSNAIKYTPDGGLIHIGGRKLPGFTEVTVTDNGIGIDVDDQQIIFEKFGRLGDTALHSSGRTKFKGGGPGLGLHIARGIIEAHGGAIWVESRGRDEINCPGSVFHVMLPARSEPPDDRSAKLFGSMVKLKED